MARLWDSLDRQALRRQFVDAWRKHRRGEPLAPLEHLIAAVVAWHPEYHVGLETGHLIEREAAENNPFLHLGLHIALREQVATDRPGGIRAIHRELSHLAADPHAAEHAMMDCLSAALQEAQREGAVPDEGRYLARLRRLLPPAGRRDG